jgi:hypothetical protein
MTGRSPDCLSDLRIDRMLAGDLDGDADARARDHLAGCGACAARVAAFEGARAATPPDVELELEAIRRVAAAPPARRIWRKLWPPLGVALAAGVAGLVVVARAPAPESTRTKGPARLGFFVKHGDAVRRGGAGEHVSPGDLVRFVVSTPRAAHLAIVSLDGRAAANVYFPPPGLGDDVAAGTDVELPRATLLDDTLGPETVAAFFCERPVDRGSLLDAVRARPDSTPPGCAVDRLDWVKVPAR